MSGICLINHEIDVICSVDLISLGDSSNLWHDQNTKDVDMKRMCPLRLHFEQ